ncbi:hypothetical protein P9112_012354 [Eukaryota sp. TZLM1-RC]
MPKDIKLCILGACGVGKTCLLHRFINNQFIEKSNTIGVAFLAHNISHDLVPGGITLNIWDTAGMEQFRSITTQYVRNADLALVCFDPDQNTFGTAESWVREVKEIATGCTIILVATKMDLIGKRAWIVSESYVNSFMTDNNIKKLFKTSAKTGLNVNNLFKHIEELTIEKFLSSEDNMADIEPEKSSHSRTCC